LKSFFDNYGPTAVILGASEGIGAAFAEELSAGGFSLLLIARRLDLLNKTAERLRDKYKVKIETLSLDLAEENPWQQIQNKLDGSDYGLVIYNAAASPIGHFLDLNLDAARRTIDVNISSPLDLVHGAGNEFRKRWQRTGKRGGIILMSSLSGLRGTPTVSAYAATKAWNLVLAEGVGSEAKPEGVDIMACVAGATDTPGYRDSLTGRGPGAPVQKPRSVARAALKKLGKRSSFIPGFTNRIIGGLMYGLIPRHLAIGILGKATSSLRSRDDARL
jgi:short-subunit dehydrogenase